MQGVNSFLERKFHIDAHWRATPWLVLALYALAWPSFYAGSTVFWFLPAGLRLGVLWILPRQAWWKMAVVEWLVILAVSLMQDRFQTSTGMLAAMVLPW